MITVFENHRKSLISHCERSELHFEWTKVIKNAKIVNLTNQKPVTYDQTALPDRSLLIEQKLAKSAKIEKFKCDIFSNFHTI